MRTVYRNRNGRFVSMYEYAREREAENGTIEIAMDQFIFAPSYFHDVTPYCSGGDSCRCLPYLPARFRRDFGIRPFAEPGDARADFEATTRATVEGKP